jgi:hypothetical protein
MRSLKATCETIAHGRGSSRAGAIGCLGRSTAPFSARSIFLTVPAGFAVYLVAIFVLRAVERDEYELAAESLLSRLQRNPPRVIVVGEDGKA